jgi:hypothetical protein
MVNSLNTLREQVFAWQKMQKAPIGEKSGAAKRAGLT